MTAPTADVTPPVPGHVLLCAPGPAGSLLFGDRLIDAVTAAADRCGYRDITSDDAGRLWGRPRTYLTVVQP